jgi:hypothetical protein
MSKRTNIRLLFTAAFVLGFAGLSSADEFIIVNGLPCGTFCRAWMGIKLPPPHDEPAPAAQPEAPRADVESPKPRHEHRKAQKPKMARRKVEHHETEVAERKADSLAERRERTSDAARGAKTPTDLSATGAVLASPVPEPPKAPAATPAPSPTATPELSVAAPEAKSQTTVDIAAPSPPPTPEVSLAAPDAKSQSTVDGAAPSPARTPEVSVAAPDAKSQSAVDGAVPSPAPAPEVTLAVPEAKSQPQVDSAAPTTAAIAPTPTPTPIVSPEAPGTSVAAAPNSEAAPSSPAASEAAAAKPEAASSANPTVTAAPTPAETPERSADAGVKPAEAPTPAPSASPAAEPADLAAADKTPATGQGAPEVATLGDAAKPPTAPATTGSANDPAATSEPKVGSLGGGAEAPSGPQMLVVLAKPEVKSVADLNDKTILVAGVTSVSGEQLKASIAVAGAGGAQLKQGDKSDIDELPRGEVAAAIVGVSTPGKAADFQEIPGFHALYIEVLPYVGR